MSSFELDEISEEARRNRERVEYVATQRLGLKPADLRELSRAEKARRALDFLRKANLYAELTMISEKERPLKLCAERGLGEIESAQAEFRDYLARVDGEGDS